MLDIISLSARHHEYISLQYEPCAVLPFPANRQHPHRSHSKFFVTPEDQILGLLRELAVVAIYVRLLGLIRLAPVDATVLVPCLRLAEETICPNCAWGLVIWLATRIMQHCVHS